MQNFNITSRNDVRAGATATPQPRYLLRSRMWHQEEVAPRHNAGAPVLRPESRYSVLPESRQGNRFLRFYRTRPVYDRTIKNNGVVAHLARSTSEVSDLPQRAGVKLDRWHGSHSESLLQLGGFVHIDLPPQAVSRTQHRRHQWNPYI